MKQWLRNDLTDDTFTQQEIGWFVFYDQIISIVNLKNM